LEARFQVTLLCTLRRPMYHTTGKQQHMARTQMRGTLGAAEETQLLCTVRLATERCGGGSCGGPFPRFPRTPRGNPVRFLCCATHSFSEPEKSRDTAFKEYSTAVKQFPAWKLPKVKRD
jgi:hypothetical protein